MSIVAWDTETALIRPALLAPPLVVATWQSPGEAAEIIHQSDPYIEDLFESWLRGTDMLVGHNVAYDFAVVCQRFPRLRPFVFAAYDADRVTDTMIRQQLLDIAAGCYRGSVSASGFRVVHKYDLEALARRCADIRLVKDGWRLSYGSFLDTPLADWPTRAREVQAEARPRVAELIEAIRDAELRKELGRVKALRKEREGLEEMIASDPSRASEYPLDDARATLAVYLSQEKHASFLADQYRQTRAAFAFYLSSAWGLRTDAAGVEKLRAAIEAEHAEVDEEMRLLGLVRENGVRDTKATKRRMIEVCAAEGIPVVRTEAHFKEKLKWAERQARGLKPRCVALDGTPLDDGSSECAEHVCLDGDACDRSGDDVLIAYAERTTLGKQLSNDIPALEKGTQYPVHTRYGLAGTGRSTSSKPNIQNQSKRPGFREAFVPRGYA